MCHNAKENQLLAERINTKAKRKSMIKCAEKEK